MMTEEEMLIKPLRVWSFSANGGGAIALLHLLLTPVQNP